jgi:predicted secreted protein
MAWSTAAAIYFLIWWLVLFCTLPIGVRNAAEDGVAVEAGNDPGAPTVIGMKFKLILTTIVSAIVFAVLWVIYVNRLVTLEDLATLWGLLK